MSVTVEDGTGRADAVSYASVADADAYHLARRNDAWFAPGSEGDLKEAALIRATGFLDATYRARFPGYRTRRRAQALEWPRTGAYTYLPDAGRSDGFLASDGYRAWGQGYDYLPSDQVPREIIAATCEAALRELIEPGALAPDLERGGAIRRLQAGSVAIEYAGNALASTTFQAIDLALASLLMPANAYSGRAVRG